MQRRGLFAVALATLGLVLSLLLERLHVRAFLAPSAPSFCAVGERLDCTSVALSPYSVFLGVPLPLWGALGFFAIGVAIVLESRWVVPLTAFAALSSVVLLAIEIGSIGALCLLCEAVHLVSFGLFALGWSLRREHAKPLGDTRTLAAIFAPPVLAFGVLVAFVPPYWGAFGWKGEPPFAHGKTSDGHPWIGASEPQLTLHEFTDYGCSHCKTASARNLRRLAEHPTSFRIVRRQYPRMYCRGHSNRLCLPMRVAYCAEDQGKFWQADRWLFQHVPPNDKIDLTVAARDIGLDHGALQACLVRSDVRARAEAEARYGMEQRFDGTPTFVVDGKRVTEATLAALVAELP
jgi:uncharacterized membrane protein